MNQHVLYLKDMQHVIQTVDRVIIAADIYFIKSVRLTIVEFNLHYGLV